MTTQTVDHLTPVQRAWVDALRSGEYTQGVGRLRRGDTFCCLGVACDLAVKAGIIDPPDAARRDATSAWVYATATMHLPERVKDWLEMSSHAGVYGAGRFLTSDNDTGVPFSLIADTIEANAAELFGPEPVA